MGRVKYVSAKSVSTWETMTADRPEIEIIEFQLHQRLVCGAKGTITANGKTFPVQWLHDGRCYYKGTRVRKYDVTF